MSLMHWLVAGGEARSERYVRVHVHVCVRALVTYASAKAHAP